MNHTPHSVPISFPSTHYFQDLMVLIYMTSQPRAHRRPNQFREQKQHFWAHWLSYRPSRSQCMCAQNVSLSSSYPHKQLYGCRQESHFLYVGAHCDR